MSDDPRTRKIAAVMHTHEWHPDGTGEGQCDCDGRWFKTKLLHDSHVADAVIAELLPPAGSRKDDPEVWAQRFRMSSEWPAPKWPAKLFRLSRPNLSGKETADE